MAYKITDKCIGCGSCAAECPMGAITQKNGKYEIDKTKCVECGMCRSVCPVQAPEKEQ